jgi:hypothetical protein
MSLWRCRPKQPAFPRNQPSQLPVKVHPKSTTYFEVQSMTRDAPTAKFEAKREEYIDRLRPLFLPDDPVSKDIIRYFASLLRALGMEDRGWDPYEESRATLDDINGFFKLELPEALYKQPDKTTWRIGLLLYSHIVEMDAPYEVITNLLRFQLGKGYSPSPFFDFLSDREKKGFRKRELTTGRKIEIIKQLSTELKLDVGAIFDEFYNNRLRNAIAHSDYILTNDDFRCRGGISGQGAFKIPYEDLDRIIMCAKAFIESFYRRTEEGVDMCNCTVDLKNASLDLFVNQYARKPGTFSPLVEHDGQPVYTKLEGVDEFPVWPSTLS